MTIETLSGAVRILTFSFEEPVLRQLSNRRRNQLFGCMHAHNELTFLNRILMFVQNTTADGELHDHAQAIQMWSALQILAGKLFETWVMLAERVLRAQPPDPLLKTLSADHAASLTWLRDYFGERQLKNSPIKIIRDKTAFHYDGLDLGQAINNLGERENTVHLARHPANTLYFLGSAVSFRATFTLIADRAKPPADGSFEERLDTGFRIVLADVHAANLHVHRVLYGLIKAMMEEAQGGDLGEPSDVINVTNAPVPKVVGLPPWLFLPGMEAET